MTYDNIIYVTQLERIYISLTNVGHLRNLSDLFFVLRKMQHSTV